MSPNTGQIPDYRIPDYRIPDKCEYRTTAGEGEVMDVVTAQLQRNEVENRVRVDLTI